MFPHQLRAESIRVVEVVVEIRTIRMILLTYTPTEGRLARPVWQDRSGVYMRRPMRLAPWYAYFVVVPDNQSTVSLASRATSPT